MEQSILLHSVLCQIQVEGSNLFVFLISHYKLMRRNVFHLANSLSQPINIAVRNLLTKFLTNHGIRCDSTRALLCIFEVFWKWSIFMLQTLLILKITSSSVFSFFHLSFSLCSGASTGVRSSTVRTSRAVTKRRPTDSEFVLFIYFFNQIWDILSWF